MNRRHRLALAALACAAFAVAGCGGGSNSKSSTSAPVAAPLTSGNVATVAGQPITAATFNHWYQVVVHTNEAGSKQEPVVPDPPSFTGCIAEARTDPKLNHGTTVQLKDGCAALYRVDRAQTMDFLIKTIWLDDAGAKLNVVPSQAEVTAHFDAEKKANFKTSAQYQAYLAATKQSPADVLLRVKSTGLETLLASKDGGDKKLVALLVSEYKPQTHCVAQYAMADCAGASSSAG